jgi:hypothetical protein
MNEEIMELIKALCHDAYWYGEGTGDYDMANVENHDWFRIAAYAIVAKVLEKEK